jgi:hypothetical protein
MKLVLAIMTFDFMGGSAVDESCDDIGSIQIPHSWKPLFEEGNMIKLLFRAYCIFPSPISSMVI